MNVNYGAIQRLRNKEPYTLPYSYKVRWIYIENTLRANWSAGLFFAVRLIYAVFSLSFQYCYLNPIASPRASPIYSHFRGYRKRCGLLLPQRCQYQEVLRDVQTPRGIYPHKRRDLRPAALTITKIFRRYYYETKRTNPNNNPRLLLLR